MSRQPLSDFELTGIEAIWKRLVDGSQGHHAGAENDSGTVVAKIAGATEPPSAEERARVHARPLTSDDFLPGVGPGGLSTNPKAWPRGNGPCIPCRTSAHEAPRRDQGIAAGCDAHRTTVERFQREVEALSLLSHPNIVTAHDADESKGIHFLVMEYVEGRDLSAHVKEFGPVNPQVALGYLVQAARGAAEAHNRGLVHRGRETVRTCFWTIAGA